MSDISKSNGVNGTHHKILPRLFSISTAPALEEFDKLCSRITAAQDYPLATSVESNIPIYELPPYDSLTDSQRSSFQDEWNHILLSGPGVFVTKSLYTDSTLIDKVNDVFNTLLDDEAAAAAAGGFQKKGDHFAASGKNARLWNSFSKHGLADPETFAKYYSNPWLPVIASSWLGPGHRITAQLNIVRPGGAPQVSHRDYHLGFQTAEACGAFPRRLQYASQFLTLQGAVAHSDVPVDSGPTRLLPFSQAFEEGYMAYRRPEFNEYFLKHWVALPLAKGDGLFFNPALFHAAGENKTADVQRSANLLQISSAFGKTMEAVDSPPLVKKCWRELSAMHKKEGLSAEVLALVGALGEGYPFPTNLDRRPPAPNGMAPESEQELLVRCLKDSKSIEEVVEELTRMRQDAMA